VGWEKVDRWNLEHKRGNKLSLKRVRIEETLLCRAYRNSPTLFRTVPSPTPLRPPLPQHWGFRTPTQNFNRYYLRKGWSCRLQIWPVHPNRNPLKILEKRDRGHIQGLPNFWVPPIISGTCKATNFKFCTHIPRIDRKKSPLKISGKVGGIRGTPKNFQGTHIQYTV